jgi:hypothetical protein
MLADRPAEPGALEAAGLADRGAPLDGAGGAVGEPVGVGDGVAA